MKCKNCGMDILNNANFCTNCGTKVDNNIEYNQPSQNNEGSTIGWGVLGFFFPLVGLILFFVFKKDRPKASKTSGIGALIGFILGTVLFILLSIIISLGFNSAKDWIEDNFDENKINNYVNDYEDIINDIEDKTKEIIEDEYQNDINKKN